MNITREKVLDYVFYLQKKLGLKVHNIVKKSTYGIKLDINKAVVSSIIQEAAIDYYPDPDVVSKVRLTISGTFPGVYNSTFLIRSKDYIYFIGSLAFTFVSLSQFNDELVSMINTNDDIISAEVDGNDIIITLPSFLDAAFTTLVNVDSGNVLTFTSAVEQRGEESFTNSISENDMAELINYAEKYINNNTC